MGTTQAPGPWAGVLLSDEEALQIIAVLADVLMAATCAMRSAPPGRCSVPPGRSGRRGRPPALRIWAASTGGWLIGLAPGPIGDILHRCRRAEWLRVCKTNSSGPSRQVASAWPPPVELPLVSAGSTLLVPLDGA
jgi:hypothetical protein